MRRRTYAAVAGLAVLVASVGATAQAGQTFKPESLDWAALVKNRHAPKANRFTLRLFTHYAHERNGDAVSAAAKHSPTPVAAHEKGPNRGFVEWRINTHQKPGRRLIAELRGEIRHKGRSKFAGLLLPHDATEPYPCTFVIHRLNQLAPADCPPIALRSGKRPTLAGAAAPVPPGTFTGEVDPSGKAHLSISYKHVHGRRFRTFNWRLTQIPLHCKSGHEIARDSVGGGFTGPANQTEFGLGEISTPPPGGGAPPYEASSHGRIETPDHIAGGLRVRGAAVPLLGGGKGHCHSGHLKWTADRQTPAG